MQAGSEMVVNITSILRMVVWIEAIYLCIELLIRKYNVMWAKIEG